MRKNDNEKKEKRKLLIFWLCLIIGCLMLITVSYTVGTTVLEIVGFNATQDVSWDVRISNVNTSIVGRASVDKMDVSDTVIKNFNVTFIEPGDSISMTFDIFNKGTLDAKLDYVNIGKLDCTYKDGTDATEYCKNMYYVVEYLDGSDIKIGDSLKAGETRKVKVTLTYYENSAPLWDKVVYINNLNISFIYGQK